METTDLAPIDNSNPISLYSLLPDCLKKAVQLIPDELLNLEEKDLIEKVYGCEQKILVSDFGMRRNLWQLYGEAQETKRQIPTNKIYKGVCTDFTFYNALKSPHRTAYLITEPTTDRAQASYILGLGWNELRKIMETPISINAKTGTPDTKLMDTKVKIQFYLDQRINGAIIQRIEQTTNQKNLNVNVTATPEQVQAQMSPEQIDARIAELEAQSKQLSSPKEVKQLLPIENIEVEVGRRSD